MPEKFYEEFGELRLDWAQADQGRLRTGIALTIAIIAVTASGWPPGDMFQRMIFWVLAAIPLACVGMGLAVGELMNARAERRGTMRADEREIEALRARIAEDMMSRRQLEDA